MEFPLSQAEFDQIKKAASMGKTMVWFDDIVISIPHISYMKKIRRAAKTSLLDYDNALSKEEQLKRISEIKNKYKNRLVA